MKTTRLTFAALSLLFLTAATSLANNRGVIDTPAVRAAGTRSVEIGRVELTDTATVLHIKAYYRPRNWIQFAKTTHLVDEQGTKYPVRSAAGLQLGEHFWMPDSGEAEFALIFPPLPPKATSVDLIEGDMPGAFNLWGIALTKDPLTISLPKDFKETPVDKKATLPPPVVKQGIALLRGAILDYRAGMPTTLSAYIYPPFKLADSAQNVTIQPDGTFELSTDACTVYQANLRFMDGFYNCFVAPGEITTIVINPAENTRKHSRLRGAAKPIGKPAYYAGYMASLSRELADHDAAFRVLRKSLETEADYEALLKSLDGKSEIELRDEWLAQCRSACDGIAAFDASPACKETMRIAAEIGYIQRLTMVQSWMMRAYASNHHLKRDSDSLIAYGKTLKPLQEDYFAPLSTFTELNTPAIVYATDCAVMAYSGGSLVPWLRKEWGTDQGIFFELVKTSRALEAIEQYHPLDADQLAEIPEAYRPYVRQENEKLQATIEANKKKTGYTVGVLPDSIRDEDILPTILRKYKGHPVLVDIWGTWCAPCREANKMLQPVKPALMDSGIAFVYIAGENSPLGAWNSMIADLHGEHYRLTDAQWNFILRSVEGNGVPTYIFVDKDGHINSKQVGFPGPDFVKNRLMELTK
ncbi:MAG: TlpA family protein disulfide reductase [Mediterranea sp.]|jgi:thiol-disulfide isomerase/thioredoxin|nr:TlpA family protein disulfide reductase [Mediterranea sp.]